MRWPVYGLVLALALCSLTGFVMAAGHAGGTPSIGGSGQGHSTGSTSGAASLSGPAEPTENNLQSVTSVDIPSMTPGNTGSLMAGNSGDNSRPDPPAVAAPSPDPGSPDLTSPGMPGKSGGSPPENTGIASSYANRESGGGGDGEAASPGIRSRTDQGRGTIPGLTSQGPTGMGDNSGQGSSAGLNGGNQGGVLQRQEPGFTTGPGSGAGGPGQGEAGRAAAGGYDPGMSAGQNRIGFIAGSAGAPKIMSSGPGSPEGFSPREGDSPARHQHRGPPETPGRIPVGPAETCSPSPVQGTSRDDPGCGKNIRPRSRREGDLSPDEDADVPTADVPAGTPFFPAGLFLLGGYRRINRKNVLEHEARNRIFAAITDHPGIDLPALAGMTGINEHTLRYHLARIVASGRIACLDKPGITRYFLNQGTYRAEDQVLLHYLWGRTPREILLLLRRSPGMTRQEISDILGIAGPSVTRQMDHLIEDGIVENHAAGRSNHYYLSPITCLSLDRLAIAVPRGSDSEGQYRALAEPGAVAQS